jgi:hypothetical protein
MTSKEAKGMGFFKGAAAKAALLLALTMLASCATLPPQVIERPSIYRNAHDIQFEYPSSWRIEDMSKNYSSLGEAVEEGAAYVQVYSYDPLSVSNPTEGVPRDKIKIAIMFRPNRENLDYPKVLAGLGAGAVQKSIFRINGREAYEVRYQVQREETTGRLDVLSIEYLDQDLYARFICYPWNSVYVREFEDLAKSFRYKGK